MDGGMEKRRPEIRKGREGERDRERLAVGRERRMEGKN